MALRCCIVSFQDADGIKHSVEIAAESLFEAATLALKAFLSAGCVDCPPGPATRIEISVYEPVVTHTVTVQRLQDWLGSGGKTPKGQALKQRLREALDGFA